MKNVYEVLRQKELELARLEKEVEALRVVAPLLSPEDAKELGIESSKPTLAQTTQQPIRIPQQAAVNQSPPTRPRRRLGRHRQTLALDFKFKIKKRGPGAIPGRCVLNQSLVASRQSKRRCLVIAGRSQNRLHHGVGAPS